MRKCTLFVLLYISYVSPTHGQVISGTIIDSKSREAIPFANVYYDQTLLGTVTDLEGNFEIEVSKDNAFPLVCSAIGYFSATIANYSNNENVKIYLDPKVYEIDETVISAKSLERKRKRHLRLFRREFIGTTQNSLRCIILNEKDITFNYDSDHDTIKVYALKPILIMNKALGYKITYYLDIFQYFKSTSSIYFRGNLSFEEVPAENRASIRTYRRKRKSAYYGSRMHFIRALHSDQLWGSGFSVRDQSNNRLVISDFVFSKNEQQSFLKNAGKLSIEYHRQSSAMQFLTDSIYFNATGFFEPEGIYWSGDMAAQRIGDCLPFGYSPDR